MGYDGISGISRLGGVLVERMITQNESGLILDFGSIQANYSLKTNTFPIAIPKSDYTVCRLVSGITVQLDSMGGQAQSITLPKLQPGDRVLVAWIKDEATVIDVIVSANNL